MWMHKFKILPNFYTDGRNTNRAFGTMLGSDADCNNLSFGIYLGCNIANAPTADWYQIIHTGVQGTAVQLATTLFGDAVYKRYCAAGNWSQWRRPNVHEQLKGMAFRQYVASISYISGRAEVPISNFTDVPFSSNVGVLAGLMDSSQLFFVRAADVVDGKVVIIIADLDGTYPTANIDTSVLLFGTYSG